MPIFSTLAAQMFFEFVAFVSFLERLELQSVGETLFSETNWVWLRVPEYIRKILRNQHLCELFSYKSLKMF